MRFRTGDVLLWRTTTKYDILEEHLVLLKGMHSGIILKGSGFGALSECGESPSNTYVTFMIDKIFPVEEVVGAVWYRPNGAAMHLIQRISGDDIEESTAVEAYKDLISMNRLSFCHSVYLTLAGYFRMGNLMSQTVGSRSNVCSSVSAHLLNKFGLLDSHAVVGNILPTDFYDLRFYQSEDYRRIDVFDKMTYSYAWYLSAILINLGLFVPDRLHSPTVDKILDKYDWPRFKGQVRGI